MMSKVMRQPSEGVMGTTQRYFCGKKCLFDTRAQQVPTVHVQLLQTMCMSTTKRSKQCSLLSYI